MKEENQPGILLQRLRFWESVLKAHCPFTRMNVTNINADIYVHLDQSWLKCHPVDNALSKSCPCPRGEACRRKSTEPHMASAII